MILVNDGLWHDELALHDELFAKLVQGLPDALPEAKADMERRLAA